MSKFLSAALFGLALAEQSLAEKSRPKEYQNEERIIKQIISVRDRELPIAEIPSWRKSKGQKSRDRSARHRKGWK